MLFDALIIGGGPAGATIALLLAQAGWSVALVEKKKFPRRKVCGEFISATSLPLLQKLGVADFYLANAGPEIKRLGLFTGNTVLSAEMPPAIESCSQWGRALGREHLDSQLLERAVLNGVQLWQPWSAKTLQRQGSIFTCTIEADKQRGELSARRVIIALGSWERGLEINKYSQIPAHRSSDLLAFKAHFSNSELPADLMPLLAFPGGYGGLVQCDNGRVSLSCCIRRDALQHARQQHHGLAAGEAVLQHLSAACLGVRQTLSSATREGQWISAGPIRPGIRPTYADGIFFVGNKAGEAHPIIAEGISMAMQSSWILSQVLLRNPLAEKNVDALGHDYTTQWHRHFSNRIRAAAAFAQIAMRPWAVSLMLPMLKQFPSLLSFGATLSGKINQVVPLTSAIKSSATETESTS